MQSRYKSAVCADLQRNLKSISWRYLRPALYAHTAQALATLAGIRCNR
ncbi:hypothetical protein [Mucilaginibacter sp.]|nr:hypothetical protein [Mucilaginibacter sp.]